MNGLRPVTLLTIAADPKHLGVGSPAGPGAALAYLSRYTHRVAISRLIAFDDRGAICPAAAQARPWPCLWPNTMPCKPTSRRPPARSPQAPMAPSCSTAPDGTPQTFSSPPKNLSLIFLPSRAPELNPAENIWQFLRQNPLSNRVFETYEEIFDAACDAWNRLIDQSWRIMSIGLRDWAQNGQSF